MKNEATITTDKARGGPRLSRARIVDAAITLMDAEGYSALTMRRLAEALSAHPMSTYRHFENKDKVVAAVREALYAELQDVGDGGDPFDDVRSVMYETGRVLERHPYMPEVFAATRPSQVWLDRKLRHVAALVEAGVPPEEAEMGFASLFRLVLGSFQLAGGKLDEREKRALDYGIEGLISRLRRSAQEGSN